MEEQSTKTKVRRMMIDRRDSMTQVDREALSDRIRERLLETDEYIGAKVVLSYANFRSEVITDGINRCCLMDGKELYLPKCFIDRKEMAFFRVRDVDNDIAPGHMGIREPYEDEEWDDTRHMDPNAKNAISSDEILIIMPGVAFDDRHCRMGYGGGYYDRFLANHRELIRRSIFIAFEEQRTDLLPSEKTDMRPKHILTEKGIV